MNWRVSIFHYNDKDYVGIDETDGPGMTEEEAEKACIKYAQENNLPLFLSFRWDCSEYV
jgi:hypothetical protein